MFHSLFRLGKQKKHKKNSNRVAKNGKDHFNKFLRIEHLESREMLSTAYWTGDISYYWFDSGNWHDDYGNDYLPQAGDDLVFYGSPAIKNTRNNFADGRIFNSLIFLSNDFSISTQSYPVKVSTGIAVGSDYNTPPITGITGTEIHANVILVPSAEPYVEMHTSSSSELSIYGIISGACNLTKTGGGELRLYDANTYSGATTVNNGLLRVRPTGSLPSGTYVTIGDSTSTADLWFYNSNQQIGSLSGKNNGNLMLFNSGVLNVNIGSGSSSTFYGKIEGEGGLKKSGNGILTLTPPSGYWNSYTGGTTIDGGMLILGNAYALPYLIDNDTRILTINNGGILDLGGYSSLPQTTLYLDNGTIQNGIIVASLAFNLYCGEISASLGYSEAATTLNKYGSDIVTLSSSSGLSMPITVIWSGALLVSGSLSGDTVYFGGEVQLASPPGNLPYDPDGTLVVPSISVNQLIFGY